MIKIELKGIQHSAFASEETHCFSATLIVDGVKAGTVSNDGHGGCDHYHWAAPFNWDSLKEINARIAADYPQIDCADMGAPGDFLTPDLETVVGELVNEWLAAKDLKRDLARKVLFTKPSAPGIYQVPLKQKGRVYPLEVAIASLRAKEAGRVFLNELPFDEALKLYRTAA